MTLAAAPQDGRIFTSTRRIRLSDTDATGRLRLDAVARYLQDVASDDVDDAGWSRDDHVWVVRRTVLEVEAPFLDDRSVELATWCSGVAAAAADRRTTLRGDRGGRIESETTWIHLDREGRPLRLGQRFHEMYTPAANGRRASTKLTLPSPPAHVARASWPLRATDADLMGHVNNAVYWAAVEELFGDRLRYPSRALLEYRHPIDVGELIDIRCISCRLWFVVDADVRAAAEIL